MSAESGVRTADTGATVKRTNPDRNEPMDESPSGRSITIWTVVEVRRRPGLDGRELLAGGDIRVTGWQYRGFVISDATGIVRAPSVRS
jgi:hypothetical protein